MGLPHCLLAPILGGVHVATPVWQADFRPLTLGDPGTLPGSLSFTRSGSGFSVQTSENTVMLEAGKSFASSNNPRCGQPRANASRGLVLEHASANFVAVNSYTDAANDVSSDLRDTSNATDFNGSSSGSVTYSAGSGSPDGVGTAKRVQVTSGSFAQYRLQGNGGSSAGTPANIVWSSWHKSSGTIQTAAAVNDGSTSNVVVGYKTLSGSWERIVMKMAAIPSAFFVSRVFHVSLGVDLTGSGGLAAAARDSEVDLFQLEYSLVPTSWIPPFTGGGSRLLERLYHATRTTVILGGRFCAEFTFAPMGGPTDYASVASVIHLWCVDSNNRGYFDCATQKIHTVVNGSDYTHNTALSWAVGDTVQIFVEAGNGVPRASYRVSTDDESTWGAAVALGTGSAQAALPGSAGDIDLLCRNAADAFASWVRAIRVFDNERPSWAA